MFIFQFSRVKTIGRGWATRKAGDWNSTFVTLLHPLAVTPNQFSARQR
jgi:hypothetical protein